MDPLLEEEGEAILQLPKIDNKITVGALIQIFILLGGFVVIWVHQSDQTTFLTDTVNHMQISIATLPAQNAEITELQANSQEFASAIKIINTQLTEIIATAAKNSADIANIKEASEYHLRK